MEIRDVSPGSALKVAVIVFGLAIALRFLWIAHPVLIVAFLGVLIGLALARAADHLERFHVKRAVSVPLVLFTVIGVVVGAASWMAPLVREQTRDLAHELPKAIDKLESLIDRSPVPILEAEPEGEELQPVSKGEPQSPAPEVQVSDSPSGTTASETPQAPLTAAGGETARQRGGLKGQLGKELRGAVRFLFPVLSTTVGAIAGLLLVLFIAVYVAISPDVYKKGLLHLVPHDQRAKADEVVTQVGATLRQWLLARLIAMLLVGLITGAGLAALQVRGAAALGLLAGLLEFVPFFGPIVSAIPGIGVALVESPEKAIWVAAFYVLVQQLESNLITPLLLKSRLDIPPVMTLLAVSALGMVFGVVGMLVAEPLLAATLVATKMLYVRDVVGDDVRIGREK